MPAVNDPRPDEQPTQTWRPRRGPLTRIVSWLILLGMAAAIIAMAIIGLTVLTR